MHTSFPISLSQSSQLNLHRFGGDVVEVTPTCVLKSLGRPSLRPGGSRSPELAHSQSATIKTYMEVQQGDDAEEHLHREIDDNQFVFWRPPNTLHYKADYGVPRRLWAFW